MPTMDAATARILATTAGLVDAVGALGQSATAYDASHAGKGLGLLDVKTHALLRYTASLARYGAARVRGGDVAPLQDELVEGWAVLERVRPLEKAAKGAVEALLKKAVRDEAGQAVVDGMRARPDVGSMVLDEGGEVADEGDEGPKKYVAPRIAEVVYDGERDVLEEKAEKMKKKMAARVARSRAVREMMAEVSGAPDEVRDEDDMDDGDAAGRAMSALRKQEEDRTRYEEDNFTRLNVTREDKRRRRTLERAAERGGHGDGGLGGDPFADLMGVAERVVGKGSQKARKAGEDRVDALEAADRGFSTEKKQKKKGGSEKKKGGKRRR